MYHLSRRGFLLGGTAALTCTRMPATPSCTLVAEQEVGPYYIDDRKVRQDITEGKPGLPLKLRIALMDSRRCAPLESAALDVWHCDASGVYSGFTANSPDGRGGPGRGGPGRRGGPEFDGRGPGPAGPPPGGPPPGGRGPGGPARQIDATRFLRGVQLTDKNGLAEFATLYPGWYSGRAIHIHLKVYLGGNASGPTHAGGQVSHTGQLFFPEDVTEEIAKLAPYARRLDIHRTTQNEDGIFKGQHGSSVMLNLERIDKRSNVGGFVATIALAVNPDAIPAPVGGRGRGGRE